MWVVVVAGGSGRRFGGPKQDATLQGRTLIEWALAAARAVADGVGETRARSVKEGLARLAEATILDRYS